MSELNKKTLIEEVIENARRDRKRLEAVADGLTNGFGQLGDNVTGEGEPLDPEVSAAFAEEIAKVSDSLSKIQQQLVEIVKIDAKRELEKPQRDPSKLSQLEKEELYEELQGSEDMN